MLRTILVGSCMSVQGLLVQQLECGKIVVQVGKNTFSGWPVNAAG